MKKCKFCGREVHAEKYLSTKENNFTCGQCTSYCTKKCELGKSGKIQGWHFEPCLSCEKNPYNTTEGGGKTARIFEKRQEQ